MRGIRSVCRLGTGMLWKSNVPILCRCNYTEAYHSNNRQQQRFSATTNTSAERSAVNSTMLTLNQVQHDARQLCGRIRESVLQCVPHSKQYERLRLMLLHHFDGEGKFIRPTLLLLLGRLLGSQIDDERTSEWIRKRYETVAMCAEMIHTASLMHDDLLDSSTTRRGKPSVQSCFGQREAVLAGDLLLSVSSRLIATLGDPLVVEAFSQALDDLVSGELMQLGKAKADDAARFTQYIAKCYLKTGSLFANCARAVAHAVDFDVESSATSGRTGFADLDAYSDAAATLGQPFASSRPAVARSIDIDENAVSCAFQFGRQFGIAFQLVDDLLDLVASSSELGKPAGADLLAGVITGPVLFAARSNAELNAIIMRGFAQSNDTHRALQLVVSSDGVAQTRVLARQHADEALRQLRALAQHTHTAERGRREMAALEYLIELMLARNK